MPEEYEKYIFYLDDESVEGLKNRIVDILSKERTELDTFGKAASDFVIKEKSPKVQMAKVLAFMNQI